MRVFISHQQDDSTIAKEIAAILQDKHSIESYLDVIDGQLGKNGEDLADYIRKKMRSCTQLMAVVSRNTKASQWVPWEIGVASEKEFPLATYSHLAPPPEFLAKWPVLKTDRDVDIYARASKAASRQIRTRTILGESVTASQKSGLDTFYSEIRTGLGRGF
ncbi:MAG: hypothetical protein COA41_09640 [Sphingopyxis sp.]|nr:MAG: hypothetical protein COA41_09640 [Sphingopyxis sp.]